MQFEERKFLETARKTILLSVTNAGQKLENDQILNMAQKDNGAKKKEEDKESNWVAKILINNRRLLTAFITLD